MDLLMDISLKTMKPKAPCIQYEYEEPPERPAALRLDGYELWTLLNCTIATIAIERPSIVPTGNYLAVATAIASLWERQKTERQLFLSLSTTSLHSSQGASSPTGGANRFLCTFCPSLLWPPRFFSSFTCLHSLASHRPLIYFVDVKRLFQ